MKGKIFKEQVDIYKFPDVLLDDPAMGNEVTIGDLHGNFMLFLFMLLKHGIASGINQQDYQALVNIYKKAPLSKADINEFNMLLGKLQFTTSKLVRLIGDELSDRGQNDYFTLKLLEKLHKHRVPTEILFSNHGVDFMSSYEKPDNPSNPFGNYTPLVIWNFGNSLLQLSQLIKTGTIDVKEVDNLKTIVEVAYKPKLKALSYTLDANDEITIYSHAPIDIAVIAAMAEKLGLPFADNSAAELAQTIDAINTQFQVYVQNNQVNAQLLVPTATSVFNHGKYPTNAMKAPFDLVTWNRAYETVKRDSIHKNYKVNYVHGHDPSGPTKDNLVDLDGPLGKGLDVNKGDYRVYCSTSARQLEMLPQPMVVIQELAAPMPFFSKPASNPWVELQKRGKCELKKLSRQSYRLHFPILSTQCFRYYFFNIGSFFIKKQWHFIF